MFHSRPSKTSNGKLVYGFSPKRLFLPALSSRQFPEDRSQQPDIFARIITLFPPVESEVGAPATQSQAQARHLAKYVFPRQFGLHNAFASPKPKHSYDIIPDYEDRELEIKACCHEPARHEGTVADLTHSPAEIGPGQDAKTDQRRARATAEDDTSSV
jgi:hypothetical protein